MKKLLMVCLLVPAMAAADRSYNSETNVTHDCATDGKVSVNVSKAVFTFTGTCDKISINGSDNKVTIEAIDKLSINGAVNTVDVIAADKISINGARNALTYKKGLNGAKPKISSNGVGNKVRRVK